jgi:hypothetical protein
LDRVHKDAGDRILAEEDLQPIASFIVVLAEECPDDKNTGK